VRPVAFFRASSSSSSSRVRFPRSMDNLINVYNYEGVTPKKIKVLEGHDGYISSIHFQDNDSKLLTGSGDGLVILWDIQAKTKLQEFSGHMGDVSGVAVHDGNPNVFGTSSTDKTCRMWDKRMPGNVAFRKFTAKYATNCCALMPDAKGIIGGCDNASWEYFDVGSNCQVARGKVKKGRCESIALSKSGKIGYLGWDGDTGLVAVDVFIPDNQKKISDGEHTDTVYNCSVAPDGTALATASFDGSTKIWSAAP
jgi:WD40 repeat protein